MRNKFKDNFFYFLRIVTFSRLSQCKTCTLNLKMVGIVNFKPWVKYCMVCTRTYWAFWGVVPWCFSFQIDCYFLCNSPATGEILSQEITEHTLTLQENLSFIHLSAGFRSPPVFKQLRLRKFLSWSRLRFRLLRIENIFFFLLFTNCLK